MIAHNRAHTGANCGAIAFGSDQFEFDPVLLVTAIVTQERRQIVHIQDQSIDIAIVIVVAKGSATARKMLVDARAHRGGDDFELPVPQIPVNESRILESLANLVAADLWIDVPVDLDDVLPAIVVKVDKSAAPRDVLEIDSYSGGKCHVTERAVSVVAIEVASIVGKICFEDIEPAIAIVISDRDPHSRLLVPILAVGASSHHRRVCERTVVIVVKQDAGR